VKQVVILVGPTASGKTTTAIALAQCLKTEIISADSRQCYRELNIGVARPAAEELAAVKHHFIASHSIEKELSAVDFEQYALNTCTDLFRRHDTVVMAGGTGLYIKAFSEGLDEIPAVDNEIRKSIATNYEEKGIGWLQQQLKEKDPAFTTKGEMQNPQRMMRALEVVEATGNSILSFQKGNKVERNFTIRKVGIEVSREELHRNIESRVDAMISAGLVEEARELMPYRAKPVLKTVGYSEIFDYLDGRSSLEEAIQLVKTHTKQYAKRQMTWFRRDPQIKWVKAEDIPKLYCPVSS
jgi:tRNA dimethylallyltransferase